MWTLQSIGYEKAEKKMNKFNWIEKRIHFKGKGKEVSNIHTILMIARYDEL